MSKVRLLLISLCAFVTAFALREVSHLIEWARPLTLAIVLPNGHVSPAERALRPVYPYSVISGGAYNPEELRYYMARDGVVRAHYADFDVNHARVVTLTEDRFQYVSYRVKSKVYWTLKKLRIPKGEVLLTDGKNFARTRCGNRLCAVLPEQHALNIPPVKTLDLPAFTIQLLPKERLAFGAPPEIPSSISPEAIFTLPTLGPFVPPALPPIVAENWPPVEVTPTGVPVLPGVGFIPTTPPPITPPPVTPPPVAPVPEPASIYLFLIAFGVSLWLITRWIRVQRKTATDGNQFPR